MQIKWKKMSIFQKVTNFLNTVPVFTTITKLIFLVVLILSMNVLTVEAFLATTITTIRERRKQVNHHNHIDDESITYPVCVWDVKTNELKSKCDTISRLEKKFHNKHSNKDDKGEDDDYMLLDCG